MAGKNKTKKLIKKIAKVVDGYEDWEGEDYNEFEEQLIMPIVKEIVEIGEPAVKPLTKAIEEDSNTIGMYCAEALSRIDYHDEKAVDALMKLVNYNMGDKYVVEAGLKAIARAGDLDSFLILWADAGDEEEAIFRRIMKNFGEGVNERVLQAVESENCNVQLGVSKALDDMEWWKAIPALTKLLQKGDENVKLDALYALEVHFEMLNNKGVAEAPAHFDREIVNQARQLLEAQKTVMKYELVRIAEREKEANLRFSALEVYKKALKQDSAEFFLERLPRDDDNWELIIDSFAEMGEPGERALVSVIENKRYGTEKKARAIEELGKTENKQFLELLLSFLESKNTEERLATVTALGQIGGEQTVEPLIEMLKDEDERIVKSAIEALKHNPHKKSMLPLLLAKHGNEREVQQVMKYVGEQEPTAEQLMVALHALVVKREIDYEKGMSLVNEFESFLSDERGVVEKAKKPEDINRILRGLPLFDNALTQKKGRLAKVC